jgi:hypothetical protein
MADNAGLIQQSSTIFDWPDTPVASLLQLQTSPSAPLPVDLSTTTGLLSPNVPTVTRLSHFPEDLYDLTDGSHLVRFLKTILGDAGAGQLRKRQLVARLQTMLNSTHFYDLDAFYGSLFGVNRGITGALPVNPYTDTATADGWDEISTIDADFREKLLRLARAIIMGGTPLGLQAMAEALTGVDCDIYEVYALMDAQGSSEGGNTWDELESDFATWDATEGGQLWSDMEGRQTFGNMGIDCRNEVVVRPKKVYDNTPDSLRERADDTRGILRVLEVLKPSFALLSVDSSGVGVHAEASIATISSPSNYWEISARVIPKDELKSWYNKVLDAYDHRANPQGIDSAQPQPPFTNTQGQQFSQVSQVVSATAQETDMELTKSQNFDKVKILNSVDYDIVHFPDGKIQTYLPSYAVIDPKRASAARTASDGVMIAAPYSGTRNTVPTAG